MTKDLIAIENLTRKFGAITALDAVDMNIRASEFCSILGPSGCGKSTLLRLLAGLDEPSEGSIVIDGTDVMHIGAEQRPTNMVFQSYAIFPHINVFDNVAYGLRRKKMPLRELRATVGDVLETVGLSGMEKRRKHELSGGEAQRVALARALVMRPKVLLLDEPMAALDKKLRQGMQTELRRLQRELGITFVMVTHDQEEALTISDRVAVMARGRVLQFASPRELYDRPCNRDVAQFVGEMNFFDGRVTSNEGGLLRADVDRLGPIALTAPSIPLTAGDEIEVGIRPEKFFLADGTVSRENVRAGRIINSEFFGESTHCFVELEGGGSPIVISVQNEDRQDGDSLNIGKMVEISWTPRAVIAMQPG